MRVWPFKRKIKLLTPLEGYNLWAASYHLESNPIKNLSDEFVKRSLPGLHGKNVLDAGCGTGKFCSLAEAQRASKIAGIDLSPAMIEVAETNCPSADLQCADLSTIEIESKTYDVIICALVLGHIENIKPALDTLLKALKSGGILLLTDFHPFLTMLESKRTFKDQQSGKSFEVRHHLHLFEEYFSIFKAHEVVVEILEEPVFNNTPVIFGIVARKK